MRPSEIRAELLGQHATLREMIEETRSVAERARRGAPVRVDLRVRMTLLADAVRRHNLHEEAVLEDIMPTIDAWGPERSSILVREHAQEHEELYAALIGIPFTVDEFAGAGVDSLLNLLLKHMEREEKAFLGEEVLRDDAVVTDQSSG
jgi:hypothetical protein